jgi:hypothetical protein
MSGAPEQQVSPPGRVYRCAWCGCGTSVTGGMPYFTYVEVNGTVRVVPGDPRAWSRSDGICPVHLAALCEELRIASCS